jgi:hypothetical protein
MISIGTVVLGLAIFEGVVGMVRSFPRELGVTLVLIATLFGLDILIPALEGFINNGGLQFLGLGPVQTSHTTQVVLAVLFTGIMVGAGFISYQGETLAYEGAQPKGIVGFLLGLLIGLVNGYLLFGTIWWIWAHYQYPFGLVEQPLPATAASVVTGGLLPLDLLAAGTASIGVGSFGVLPIILILLVVLKVLR